MNVRYTPASQEIPHCKGWIEEPAFCCKSATRECVGSGCLCVGGYSWAFERTEGKLTMYVASRNCTLFS